jgi:hypothetical protein
MPATATEISKQEIIAANLRYGSVAEPLRKRAYAQVVLKALLSGERGAQLKTERIRQNCAAVMVDAAPRRESVETALQFLIEQGQVEQIGAKRYMLKPKEWDALRQQLQVRRSQVRAALTRHFRQDLGDDDLRGWLEVTGAKFFAEFGDRWVASLSRTAEADVSRIDVEELVYVTAVEKGLGAYADDLTFGFLQLLRSPELEDQELLWHYGRAMLAARLMAADLASDPISSREFAESVVLLDTNVLVRMALDRAEHRPGIEGLVSAFRHLTVQAKVIAATKIEYEELISGWRTDTLEKIDRFGVEVVRRADDDSIRAAVERGCTTREDFSQFFDSLVPLNEALPERFEISDVDDESVNEAAGAGASKATLTAEINAIYLDKRGRRKREVACVHDAALTEAGRAYRSKPQRCWILTMDRTLEALAGRWAGPTGEPLWIALDSLIQILAVEEENSGFNARAFAPLLVQLIGSEVETSSVSFKLADLKWLELMIANTNELDPHDVVSLCKLIHRKRLAGAERDDPELRLIVERSIQTARTRVSEDLEKARAGRNRAEEQAAGLLADKRKLTQSLIREKAKFLLPSLVRAARRRLVGRIALSTVVAAGAGALIAVLLDIGWQTASPDGRVQLVLAIALPAMGFIGWLYQMTVPRYREEKAAAPLMAHERAKAEIEAEHGAASDQQR